MINKYVLNSMSDEDFKGLCRAIDIVFKRNNATHIEIASGNEIIICGDLIKLYVELDFGVFAGSNSYKSKFFRCVVWEEKKLVVDKIIAFLVRNGYSGGVPCDILKTDAYLYMIENQVITYTEEDVWDNADDYLFEENIDFKEVIATYDFRDYSFKIKNKKLWNIYLLKNDCLNRGKNVFLKYNPNYDKVIIDLCEKLNKDASKYLKE